MTDLFRFREEWEQAPEEVINNQIKHLEAQISTLKTQLFTRNIPRRDFYNQYEDVALQTQQLQHILKLRGYR
jgi:flagellar capping protein FliD